MAVIIIVLVIMQRLVELFRAKNNTRYMHGLGAFEIGAKQHKYFILLHCSFFMALLTEVYWYPKNGNRINWWPLGIFILAQGLRIWCISTLGRFWNTRVLVLPGAKPVIKGPYRYIRHPNYLAVVLEIAFLPLVFGAWYTAIVFSIANGFLLNRRIKVEEWGLKATMDYEKVMRDRPRLIPKRIV